MKASDLQVFYYIAKEGSITLGARKAGVSQPTATRKLQKLEDVLGVKLVHRQSGEYFTLSEDGKQLLDSWSGVANVIHDISNNIEKLIQPRGHRIVIKSGLALISSGPFLEFGKSQELREFKSLDIELAQARDFRTVEYSEVLVTYNTKLLPNRPDIKVRKVCDTDIGIFGLKSYLEKYPTEQTFFALKSNDTFVPSKVSQLLNQFHNVITVDDIITVRDAVLQGVGVGFLPFYAPRYVRELYAQELLQIFPECTEFTPIYLAYLEDTLMIPGAHRLIETLHKVLKTVINDKISIV